MPQKDAKEQRFREASELNLHSILMAFHKYEAFHGAFPPPAVWDTSGRPLLSWRVLLLPFLDQAQLYGEFRLDEPWDSEHNRQLIDRIPETYSLPGRDLGSKTVYMLLTGERTYYPGNSGPRYEDIMNAGHSDQILLIEVNEDKAQPWTRPVDYIVDPNSLAADLGDVWTEGCVAGFAGGDVHLLKRPIALDRRFWRIANPYPHD